MRSCALLALLAIGAAPPQRQERSFLLTSFERVRIEGPFDVELVPGSPRGTAIGDGRAIERVSLRVDGNTLVVSAGNQGWAARAGEGAGSAKIRIQTPALTGIQTSGGPTVRITEMRGDRADIALNGAGSISVGSVRADRLGVTLMGSGSVTLAGSARAARLRSLGAGSIDAGALTADEAVILSESSGMLRLTVRFTAQVAAMGSGAVSVLGRPKCRVSGPGPIDCADSERRK